MEDQVMDNTRNARREDPYPEENSGRMIVDIGPKLKKLVFDAALEDERSANMFVRVLLNRYFTGKQAEDKELVSQQTAE